MVRRARVEDLHEGAAGMPHVTVHRPDEHPVYQVGGKSFVFFRTPRPDALDPVTGERLTDVVVLWVASEEEKQVLLASDLPLFTTPHFDGHRSVLLRASHVGRMDVETVTELVQDAWLAQASKARGRRWLAEHGLPAE